MRVAYMFSLVLTIACGTGSEPAGFDAGPSAAASAPPTSACRAGVPCACEGGTGQTACAAGHEGECVACAPEPPPVWSWWRDVDGDGYGAGEPREERERPEGYADRGGDCADLDKRAHPGQTRYFTGQIDGFNDGFEHFDFDCDGKVTSDSPDAKGWCEKVQGGGCKALPPGGMWFQVVPWCGTQASWIVSCDPACEQVTELRYRACR